MNSLNFSYEDKSSVNGDVELTFKVERLMQSEKD